MNAKIITKLSADPITVFDGDHREPFGTLQHVAHMPHIGVICQIKLGSAGLQYCRGGVTTHVIPLKVLITLFEQLEPKFAEPPNGDTRPNVVDELGAPAFGTAGVSPASSGGVSPPVPKNSV